MTPYEFPYEIVRMCAEGPYPGGDLAVVPDAAGLDAATMATVAAGLGTTETVFVRPAGAPGEDYRVRVFQPTGETPFGSHSAIGTAATLVRLGIVPAGPVTQGCGAARQTLTADAAGAALLGRDPLPGTGLDPGPLLAAAGLTRADTPADPAGDAPTATGFGAPFPLLPVRGSALARARPDPARMAAEGLKALCLVATDPAPAADPADSPNSPGTSGTTVVSRTADRAGRSDGSVTVRARLFAPGFGIPDDPACAPVALALGRWLAATGRLPAGDGVHRYTVRLGAGTPRTGRLECAVTVVGGRPVHASAAGDVTPVTRGTVAVPPPPAD
ncbi:PhzF family phenazine biosynthesis protein [Streptomyces sp. NPDC020875]|uniref:PhzF family phenazine biosynthesis protein n=1 Tax=Streptomyces sp. NPDC020875 TaxID=3154898 RepID=UPI0033C03036